MPGWDNPLPIVLGGDPTDIASMYEALRDMTGGETGGPGPRDGIDDSLRQAKATGLACAERAIERAFFQAFPGLSSDFLPLWQKVLLTAGGDTDVELRALLTEAWLSRPGSTTPHLTEALTAISPKLSIVIEDPDTGTLTWQGKYVGPDDGVPPYAVGAGGADGHNSSHFPNYATADILRVVYALDPGEFVIPDDVQLLTQDMLHARLRSDQTWSLTTLSPDGPGFLLDGGLHGDSLLDLTGLG